MIDRKMQIVFRETKELIPYISNAKTHTDRQVQQIAASIKEFGFMNPILIDEGNLILAGHGRLQASQLLKIKEVPCIEAKHLDGAQKKAYIIADNQLTLNTGFDRNLLKIDLDELQELGGVDLDALGFDEKELESLLKPPVLADDIPEDIDDKKEKDSKTCPHCGKEI